MRELTRVLAGTVVPALVVGGALGGCSSDSKDPGFEKAKGTNGHLAYTGAASGGFDVTKDVGCIFTKGKLAMVTAPSDRTGVTAPSFVGSLDHKGVSELVTQDRKTFVATGTPPGITATKEGDNWTVYIADLKITDAIAGSVTVNGHLDCTKNASV